MKWYRCSCAMYVVYKETSLAFWTVQGGKFLAFPQSLPCPKSPDCTKYNDTFIIFWFVLVKKQIHCKWTFVYCCNIKCMSFVNNSVERNILQICKIKVSAGFSDSGEVHGNLSWCMLRVNCWWCKGKRYSDKEGMMKRIWLHVKKLIFIKLNSTQEAS